MHKRVRGTEPHIAMLEVWRMKKLNKIAEAIADYYKNEYGHVEIHKCGIDALGVIFYSYQEPEIGYLIQYNSDGHIEIEHLNDIKKKAPVLYREIKDLIDEE